MVQGETDFTSDQYCWMGFHSFVIQKIVFHRNIMLFLLNFVNVTDFIKVALNLVQISSKAMLGSYFHTGMIAE